MPVAMGQKEETTSMEPMMERQTSSSSSFLLDENMLPESFLGVPSTIEQDRVVVLVWCTLVVGYGMYWFPWLFVVGIAMVVMVDWASAMTMFSATKLLEDELDKAS